MSKFKTNLTRPEEMFLCAIAIASVIACATSFYVGYQTHDVVASVQQEDAAPRTPLPAGPRR
jgi:hypothetical protein